MAAKDPIDVRHCTATGLGGNWSGTAAAATATAATRRSRATIAEWRTGWLPTIDGLANDRPPPEWRSGEDG